MSRSRPLSLGRVLVALAAWFCTGSSLYAQSAIRDGHSFAAPQATDHSSLETAQLQTNSGNPIEVSSQYASHFTDAEEQALVLRGNCRLQQGDRQWTAPLMVIWESSPPDAAQKRIVAYIEGTAEMSAMEVSPGHREQRPYMLIDLETSGDVLLHDATLEELPQMANDPAYVRARLRRQETREGMQSTQYTLDLPFAENPYLPPVIPQLRRRVSISPRFLGESFCTKAEPSTNTTPQEWVITFTGGINIVVENVPLNVNGQTVLTRLDLTADRAVIWTDANYDNTMSGFELDENTPFQVYLEGNIVVLQGSNNVRASHAFYDINHRRGLALNAEIRSLLPDYEGTLRLRAAEVRQYSENNFHAHDAWVTTSEFGQPKYRVQASDIFLEERFAPGGGHIDTATGQQDQSALWVTSLNNRFLVGNTPIFAAPYLSTPAEEISVPIHQFNVGYSGMFGATLETAWSVDSLFGLSLPRGVSWDLLADYRSARGPALGTRGKFDFDSAVFGIPVHNEGLGNIYYTNDHGRDNLGLGRRDLTFPNDNRGRILARDRMTFDPENWLQLEIGQVINNDRNFVEQYFENDWDRDKDLENIAQFNHQYDNLTASALASVRSYNFENQTNWLPKGDLTLLGEPLFGSSVLWSTHSTIGSGHLLPAQAPPNTTTDPFVPLPYYPDDIAGAVMMSRHELDLPFNVGPVKVVPYVLGEAAYWQEDITGNDDLARLYGSAGVRANIQFSKYMPQVRSDILGLNGLAHKVTYDMEYYYAKSSADLSQVPQYNEFDENAQERFRERYIPIEFGGVLPAIYDPRFYAVRTGAGRDVTAPYYELVDSQQVLRLGMHHRWQTKVGPPDALRVIDWMELDLGLSLFPDANRDNFGDTLGLINGRYAWHVGPRTTLLADGVFDVFDGGQKLWNVGVLNQRSSRGSVYLGFRNVDVGPVNSQLVTSSFTYVMSPNLYVATAGISYDVAEHLDRGESLTITRIGEYFLLHFGFGYDRSRNNVGVALSLEPKFGNFSGNSMQLNSLLGIR